MEPPRIIRNRILDLALAAGVTPLMARLFRRARVRPRLLSVTVTLDGTFTESLLRGDGLDADAPLFAP